MALLRGINVGGRNRILMADLSACFEDAGHTGVRTYLYDVPFLLPPLRSDEALAALTLRAGVDAAWPGPGVIYSSRAKALAWKSGLSRIAAHPFYERMTIRNWNTTTRLLALMAEV